MSFKSVIFGCSGHRLTPEESDFFSTHLPWGFILFSRNIDTPRQVKDLCTQLRSITGSASTPIFIDQEGGRVQRLRPPHWQDYPPANSLTQLSDSERAVWLQSRLHSFDLLPLGITANCYPVLDLLYPQTHDIIGTRSYGRDPAQVARLCKSACEGLKSGGVLPVIKHIPGHGRATCDSHEQLPTVTASHADLSQTDFAPFIALRDEPMAMTAHIVYEALDSANPATTSKYIINDIIRGEIGFDNLLMSDDISMNALTGTYTERTESILSAGCDIVLHCNGDMSQMLEIANSTPKLTGKSLERANSALAGCTNFVDKSDESLLRSEFDSLLRG